MPGVLGADWDAGWIALEWIEGGRTVRVCLDEWAKGVKSGQAGEKEGEEEMLDLMRRVGAEVGKLHALGVCHGDLTTSNIMLQSPSSPSSSSSSSSSSSTTTTAEDKKKMSLAGTIYLIDFGLTSASIADEDKAVDLYVLERAFSATHPAAEPLFQEVLKAYAVSGKDGGKAARNVLKRLEGVRLRGRKRSMLG